MGCACGGQVASQFGDRDADRSGELHDAETAGRSGREGVSDVATPEDLARGRHRSSATAGVDRIDRIPPHSIEAEQGVLGCIMWAYDAVLGEAVEAFPVGADVFYDLRHQEVFTTLLAMYQAREGMDLITLQQKLKDGGKLAQVGGLEYLASLPDRTPSPSHFGYYAEIILEKYFQRKMIQFCEGAAARLGGNLLEPEAVFDAFERDVMKLQLERTKGRRKIKPMKELINENINTIEQHQAGVVTGLKTGFADLDVMTGGLKNKEFYLIAARPSIGKTSLGCNIAEHTALTLQVPVGFFSLEMAAAQLSMRFLSSQARVNMRTLRDGFLAERDFPKLTGAAGRLSKSAIWIDDESALNILQIRARARRMKQEYDIGLFIIDYLQIIQPIDRRATKEQSIDDSALGCKEMAKELDCPVLALGQLNREAENNPPSMAHIRGSGAVEQHADLIGLMFSPKDDKEQKWTDIIPVTLRIAKQRNGPTGDVDLTFLKSYTRFESAAKVGPEDVPDQKTWGYTD